MNAIAKTPLVPLTMRGSSGWLPILEDTGIYWKILERQLYWKTILGNRFFAQIYWKYTGIIHIWPLLFCVLLGCQSTGNAISKHLYVPKFKIFFGSVTPKPPLGELQPIWTPSCSDPLRQCMMAVGHEQGYWKITKYTGKCTGIYWKNFSIW